MLISGLGNPWDGHSCPSCLMHRLLNCDVSRIAVENHSEGTGGPECSGRGSNGYASGCPWIVRRLSDAIQDLGHHYKAIYGMKPGQLWILFLHLVLPILILYIMWKLDLPINQCHLLRSQSYAVSVEGPALWNNNSSEIYIAFPLMMFRKALKNFWKMQAF